MDIVRADRKILILNDNTDVARSQKRLLKTLSDHVIFKDPERFKSEPDCQDQDIIVINLDFSQPTGFATLDRFIRVPDGPSILITAFEDEIFQTTDTFYKKTVKILFRPFSSKAFVTAINDLSAV